MSHCSQLICGAGSATEGRVHSESGLRSQTRDQHMRAAPAPRSGVLGMPPACADARQRCQRRPFAARLAGYSAPPRVVRGQNEAGPRQAGPGPPHRRLPCRPAPRSASSRRPGSARGWRRSRRPASRRPRPAAPPGSRPRTPPRKAPADRSAPARSRRLRARPRVGAPRAGRPPRGAAPTRQRHDSSAVSALRQQKGARDMQMPSQRS